MVKATVAAVIARSGQDRSVILLTRRSVNPFKGYWCLPGGHIDAGETAIAAVGREVVEETGLTFAHPEFFCYSDERFPEHNFHAVALAFSGTASGDLLLMPEEVESAGWFTLEEAFSKPLAFNHESILKRYAAILEI
ncbi:MAG: NUDIX hydrolase [Chlorobium sp.]|uniref:NUDIX hydrolase n=1 Tax=Chlorobium sp. TaxID=1095 RepID=UPI0025B88237|nr:NUDIX hydrolase [Chlorobium sp.]MCF8216020.1 NUDIX hydrolase [Chlorobium sp.]MCF8270921.1 NUDIX hydrolase [Chlorobium sp.]MCF8287295.1 NUDIX hydrolase [Chlorobium sp.]MCF8291670.1 NUDIX hydrolase [Chlorobium sp.]MCF8384929.1 NUDIX hydrolase [Chlorobium sp.]